jgi:hypothetical protein
MYRTTLATVALLLALAACSSSGDPTVAAPTFQPVGGQFTFASFQGHPLAVDVDASSDGSSLEGTFVVSDNGEALYTVELQCLRRFDDQTWILAGAITPEPPESPDLIKWTSVIVRDGSPQSVEIYGVPATSADDCEEFVSEIPDSDVTAEIGPMLEGEITLPPAPSAN